MLFPNIDRGVCVIPFSKIDPRGKSMTDEEVTEALKRHDNAIKHLHSRLFRAERRLMMTGALLTHNHQVDSPAHEALEAKLKDVFPEVHKKLEHLDTEAKTCCPMMPGH
jgi:hypothetical protein